MAREIDMVARGDRLIAKEDHLALDQQRIEKGEHLRRQRIAKIDAVDLGADRRMEIDDLVPPAVAAGLPGTLPVAMALRWSIPPRCCFNDSSIRDG